MLEEVNSLLHKYFLSNQFKEMSQISSELLKDLIWFANNLIQHEISYHQTSMALEVGLLQTFHTIAQECPYDFEIWKTLVWGFSLLSHQIKSKQPGPYYVPFLTIIEVMAPRMIENIELDNMLCADILNLIAKCSIKCDSQDVIKMLQVPYVIPFVMEQANKRDLATIENATTIIG